MKTLLRSIVASILASLARAIVAKYEPTIVMVTGSVGKTSTKDAAAVALSARYRLRASEKSYNSEFGVPLTIIGAKNPWENAAAWFEVIGHGVSLILTTHDYPEMLVLEVGADRPGDLEKILRIATPDAVIVTRLPDVPVHVEAYASPQEVRDEEFRPAYALRPGCPLVISADDEHARAMAERLDVNVLTVGYANDADVHIGIPAYIQGGMQAMVTTCGEKYTLRAEGALGRSQIYAPAMALALATMLNMSASQAEQALRGYVPPPGRARVLSGIKGSLIVDDSYNASPAAVAEALMALQMVPYTRRIAVLGDMLELGRFSREEHEQVGKLAYDYVDLLITVGPRSEATRDAARAAGMRDTETLGFSTSLEAAHALQDLVHEGDVIVVKGSQGMRMERISEALIADPADARFLVRQDKEWKRR